jgi:hypothetical protein
MTPERCRRWPSPAAWLNPVRWARRIGGSTARFTAGRITATGKRRASAEIKPFRFLALATVGLAVVFASYVGGLLIATWPISEISIGKAAAFGDSFGAITSLFAGLGFAGILATIFLQREELKLTRRELEETKKTLTRQRFEDTFYRLIELYRLNLEAIVVPSRSKPSRQLRGLDALSYLNERFKQEWKRSELQWPRSATKTKHIAYTTLLASAVRKTYVRQARYIDTLINILELIEAEAESEVLITVYSKVLCSQLTAVELTYIFYQAFINPDFHLLRHTLCNTAAFNARVRTLQIPSAHRQAWNLLYAAQGTVAPKRQTRYQDTVSIDMRLKAQDDIRQLRAERR